MLWNPLCVAALSTPVNVASAKVFINILNDSFNKHESYSNLLFATNNLSSTLPKPAHDFILNNGGQIHLNSRVKNIEVNNNNCTGIYINNSFIKSSNVIIATSAKAALKLTEPHNVLKATTALLASIKCEPITTVYLEYEKNVKLTQEMYGMSGTIGQWVFDRKFCNQPGLLAVVITGTGKHTSMPGKDLYILIANELHNMFKFLPKTPIKYKIITEKFAAFNAGVNCKQRIVKHNPLENLWVAGDYNHPKYPSTLESAIDNGINIANQIIRSQ